MKHSSHALNFYHEHDYVTLRQLIQLQQFSKQLIMRTRQTTTMSGQFEGSHRSLMHGRGIEFAEVRIYQSGDDIRYMDWRVTARTGRPHIKLYHPERELAVYFLIDCNPSMYFATRNAFKFVIAAQIASLLGWATINEGNRIGGILYGQQTHSLIELPPRTRRQGLLPLLKYLADTSKLNPAFTDPRHSLIEALRYARKRIKPGSIIYLLSDFYEQNLASIARLLTPLRRENDITAIWLRDPLEQSLPRLNQPYYFSDGKQFFEINQIDKTFNNHYQAEAQQHQKAIQALMRQAKIPLLEINTTDDILKKLSNAIINS